MDPEAVGGEEGLATALLITDKGVLSSVSLLVGAQVACCAVGSGTALKGALVPLYLETEDTSATRQKSCPGPNSLPAWFPGNVDDTKHGKPPLTRWGYLPIDRITPQQIQSNGEQRSLYVGAYSK